MIVPVTVVHDTLAGFMTKEGFIMDDVEVIPAKQGVDVELHVGRTSSLIMDGVQSPEPAREVCWMLNDSLTLRWQVYTLPERPGLAYGHLIAWHKDASDPDKHYIGTTTLLECSIAMTEDALMFCLEAFATAYAQQL